MCVLDVGCGSGATLLKNGHRFASGLGIDDDPARIGLAEEALRRKGRSNVELRLLDFLEDGHELEPESFDFVFSERGPIGYDSYGVSGIESSQQRPALFPRVGLGCGRYSGQPGGATAPLLCDRRRA